MKRTLALSFAALTACSEYDIKKHHELLPPATDSGEELDPIEFNSGEILQACLVDDSICPVDLETDRPEQGCVDRIEASMDLFEAKMLSNAHASTGDDTLTLDDLYSGTVPFQVLGSRNDYEANRFSYGVWESPEDHMQYFNTDEYLNWATRHDLLISFKLDSDIFDDYQAGDRRDFQSESVLACGSSVYSKEFGLIDPPDDSDDLIAERFEISDRSFGSINNDPNNISIKDHWGRFIEDPEEIELLSVTISGNGYDSEDNVSLWNHVSELEDTVFDFGALVDEIRGGSTSVSVVRQFPE